MNFGASDSRGRACKITPPCSRAESADAHRIGAPGFNDGLSSCGESALPTMRGNRDQTTTHSRWPYSSGWKEAGGMERDTGNQNEGMEIGGEGVGRREKSVDGEENLQGGGRFQSAGRTVETGLEGDTLAYLDSGQRSNQRRRRGQSLPQRD
jgi:hypothetical protein